MIKSKNALVGIGILVFILTAIAIGKLYISFSKVGTESSSYSPARAQPAVEPISDAQSNVSNRDSRKKTPAGNASNPSYNPSAEELEQHRHWEELKGYIRDSYNRYESLDEQSLQALASSGDVGAIQYLANKTLTTNPVETIRNYELAAVHGSTAALLYAADVVMFHENGDLKLDTDGQEFSPPYRALTYALAAQLRGDNVGGPVKVRELIEKHDYTQAVIKSACKDAREKINELEKRRINAGMNRFENTVSPLGESFVKGNFAEEFCGDVN